MKLGIIGFPGSGKTTLFNALTGQNLSVGVVGEQQKGANIGVAAVPDERLDFLGKVYKKPKVIHASVQFVDQAFVKEGGKKELGEEFLSNIRPADALMHVVRCFEHPVYGKADPMGDIEALENELILADYLVVEKRLERIKHERKKGKAGNPREVELLEKALSLLEEEKALRFSEELVEAPELRGYTFLSAKPCIIILNEEEDSTANVDIGEIEKSYGTCLSIKGKLEMELSQLPPEEVKEFMEDFGVSSLAREKVIKTSYETLKLISFFTIGKDEVKAWTIREGTPALKAAGAVHTDMEKGFIRAEVISFDDFVECGSYQNAQKKGKVRLEGKNYIVQDGDIINFRFNV